IDRDRAATLGLSIQQIEDTLFSAYKTQQMSQIYAPQNEYIVIMKTDPSYQSSPQSLSTLYVHSTDKQLVPLDAIAHIVRSVGPLSVTHSGQLPSVTLSFNLK